MDSGICCQPDENHAVGGVSQEEQDGDRARGFQDSQGKSRIVPDTSILSAGAETDDLESRQRLAVICFIDLAPEGSPRSEKS